MSLPAVESGNVYGKLTATREAPKRAGYTYWFCKCNCGWPAEIRVRASSLQTGNTRSCGCLKGKHLHIRLASQM